MCIWGFYRAHSCKYGHKSSPSRFQQISKKQRSSSHTVSGKDGLVLPPEHLEKQEKLGRNIIGNSLFHQISLVRFGHSTNSLVHNALDLNSRLRDVNCSGGGW